MQLILDGKNAAVQIKATLKEKISKLERKLCLAIIFFNDPSSASYLKGRMKIAEELGVELKIITIDDSFDNNQLVKLIVDLNKDSDVDGIIIDRPIPKRFNESEILSLVSVNKDVDGTNFASLGKLAAGQDTFVSCTPTAAVELAKFYGIEFAGKDCLVIGRSVTVGKPLALLLTNLNATVTIAHSKTVNLKEKIKKADIIFLAVGKANFLKKEDITDKTVIVDIGINFDENGKLTGDASKDCYELAAAYSPVPGGVGVMTNVALMENLYKAHINKRS